MGGAAAIVLAAGMWLGRRFFARKAPSAHEAAAADPDLLTARLERLGISEREHEVLALVAAGLSNQEIAARLFIAETTVKSHVSSLLAKLEARHRTEAVSRAQEEGIL